MRTVPFYPPEYPDAHHTFEFEPNPDLYANDLADWLDAVLRRATTPSAPIRQTREREEARPE